MMRMALAGAAGLMMVATPIAAETERQLEAHEHGHGVLNMAVEGGTLEMELEVPGADIVGFEHVATTQADKKLIETAKETLSQPTTLFVLPAEADCKVTSASVEVIEGEDDHAEEDDHVEEAHDGHAEEDDHAGEAHDGHAEEAHDDHDDEHAAHSEFHARYTLTCARIEAVTTVAFPYFEQFPNSQELAVTLITEKGQSAFEVTRDQAIIQIQGMM